MKDLKTLQKVFGIMCALMTVALGTVTVMMFVPYLGGELAKGVFLRMFDGLGVVSSTIDVSALTILFVDFVLPTVLLAVAAVLLLTSKRDRNVVIGSGVAILALLIVGHFTAIFSKPLFVHWQWLYLLLLGLGSVAFWSVLVLTLLPIMRKNCPLAGKNCQKVGTAVEPAKGNSMLQKVFGIICALMTVALGTVTVMMFVPYLGGELAKGVFLRMFDGLGVVSSTIDVSALTILFVDFVLPTVLLAVAAVLLLTSKRDRNVVIGSGVAILALLIVGHFTAIFSKPLFVHWQWLYLLLLGLGSVAFWSVLVLTLLQVKRSHCQPTLVDEVDAGADESASTVVAPEQPATPAVVETEKQGVLVVGEEEILVRYNRSFVSKLMQASDEVKGYYADLTNHALSYKKVKNRISWPSSTLKHPSGKLATLTIKGKTLYVYLAMDPAVAKQTIKGTIKDVSDKKRYQAVPSLFKVKSALSLRKAKVLLDALMSAKGIEFNKPCDTVNAQDYPYDTTENLIKNGLIKVRAVDGRKIEDGKILRTAGYGVVTSVTAEQAHNMIADEVASTLVQTAHADTVVARAGRKFAVNIDTLSQNFANGDVVTIDALKQKGLVPKKEVAIKILARGTLDKVLTVEADAFSLDAIKMIVLVGGTAIKK